MKLRQLKEAKYSAPPTPDMFFVVEEADGITLVGPFGTADDARAFSKHIHDEYGEDLPVNHDIVGIQSPDQYEKDVKEHRDWLFSED